VIELTTDQIHAFLDQAIAEARLGWDEGGIPIGSVLVKNDMVIGRGHNRRHQQGSAILHAEMDCLENAGRLTAADYRECVLFSTLSPCDMCSGASLLYKIPQIIVGENVTFRGPEEYLRSRGVNLSILGDERCIAMMKRMIAERPTLWFEDIGEPTD
jgi:cytosine deaminase